MSRYTNDERRMSPARSASTRSRATRIDRMRARRRRARMQRIKTLLALIVLAALIAAVGLMIHNVRETQRIEAERLEAERYPIRYRAEIEAAADEFWLEPAYVYAIVLAESSFRTDAVSNVGALGLMQIMPETGKWIAKKFDMGDVFTAEMLTDPAVNARFGSWYLRFLLDRYDGDKRCATAAFHAGQGTVDKWRKDPACSPDGIALETIPSEVTDNYVNKVLKYYDKYLSLLSEVD